MLENYTYGEKLGEGTIGRVYKATHNTTHEIVAIKKVLGVAGVWVPRDLLPPFPPDQYVPRGRRCPRYRPAGDLVAEGPVGSQEHRTVRGIVLLVVCMCVCM